MDVSEGASQILAGLLEARTGQQLTLSRRWRIEAALRSVMRMRNIDTLDELVARLVTGGERELADGVVEALLNNETYFFRDRGPFELLGTSVLLRLREARARQRRLSIWCAGVSTGQEAYSLAMIFAEQRRDWLGWTIDILGTDVSAAAIGRARAGLYSQFEVQRGLPVVQMLRWFDAEGSGWRIARSLTDSVRFVVHSILDPAPRPGCFDLILCRNLLLYFSPEVRRAAFARLAQAAAADGALMLGAGETVIGATDRFVPDPEAPGFYCAAPAANERIAHAG